MRMTWPYLGKESEDALPQEGGCLVPRSPCGLVTVQGQQGGLWAQSRDRDQQAGTHSHWHRLLMDPLALTAGLLRAS